MKNIKIKHKLIALSCVLLVALIITSATSLILMAEINKGTTMVSLNWLPSVIVAEELNTTTSVFRIVEASHVISQDESNMAKQELRLQLVAQEIDELFNEYKNELVTNEVDRALLEDAIKLWDQYLQIHSKMIEYSKQNDTESAMFIIEHESEQVFDEVSDVFLELVKFNKAGADQANIDGDDLYVNAIVFLTSLVFFGVVTSFVCSVFIISSIVKPVSEIEQSAIEILEGNLSTEIKYTSDDELGNLSNSMRNLCKMIQEMIEDLGYVLGGLADGDYSVKSKKADLYVGDFSGIIKFTDNISEKLEESILKMQHKDQLTGFANRAGFSTWVDFIKKNKPNSMGVISVNINGLKNINETSGIVYGDLHIKNSAILLKEYFNCNFFRMSGDEILGVSTNVDQSDFEDCVVKIHKEMKKTSNYDFALGHSWTKGNIDLSKLMFEAETIMYINKQEYYHNSNREYSNVSDTLLSELLLFIENDEFMIYLQPQMKLKDDSLYGAEALIRRFDKTNQKMVFPDQFIPLYEQKSIIRHVDIFVVEEVCKLLRQWDKEGKAIPISVNLSRVTLQEYGIVDTIVKICDKHNVPHNLLVIEVTERVGLIENNVASSLITNFKDNGFNISLDDFGCAYSNIVTLAQIEVDEVKIDKSLVDDLTTNSKNYILVKNVLSMCNELEGASTLAEGIEDEEQANTLKQLGCHIGQGYFYSRPIPVNEFYEKYVEQK